jgi:hypothetical protein
VKRVTPGASAPGSMVEIDGEQITVVTAAAAVTPMKTSVVMANVCVLACASSMAVLLPGMS